MNLFHESRLTLRLAIPLIIGQLSQMILGLVDSLMVGHLGVTPLAALTFANALFYLPFIFGVGLLTSVSVFTSNARGAEDPTAARSSCRHGLYLALGLGIILFAASWVLSLHLERLGQPPDVAAQTTTFFRILMASMIPALAATALKNHADALNRPWPPFWIFLSGVALNVLLNWIMIHGKFGCPALGFEGAAWATLIARIAMLIAMFIWLHQAHGLREWVPYHWLRVPDFSAFRRLFVVGFPASIQMGCEVSAFSAAGLMIGRFGPEALAAHQIAISLAGTAFMIPLGLSMALTVRMGEAFGAGEMHRLRPISLSGWFLGMVCGLATMTTFLVFGEFLAGQFIKEHGVISLAASLLVIVGFFQLVDSLQVVSSAMLRGLQDTAVPALMGFVAYWIVGLPVSIGLAFWFKMGATGVWWGLAAGLLVACLTLGPRLWKKTALR